MLKHHKWKLFLVGMGANLTLIASLATADLKLLSEINWLDVLGEGGAAALALVWLGLILHSRPAGRVTQYLSLGLSSIFIAGFQDLLDEFIRFPDGMLWDHWIESGCMPIGLVLLTLGIYHWHKEQLGINEQLRKRERLFREHRSLDFITSLSGADYLRKQLLLALPEHRSAAQPLALLFIDVDNFSDVNHRYGYQQGDHLLQLLSELILLNIRRSDLLCRYAGDRFALILPNTGRVIAENMACEISLLVKHFSCKTLNQDESIFISVSLGVAIADINTDSPQTLIDRANLALLHAKEKRRQVFYRAA